MYNPIEMPYYYKSLKRFQNFVDTIFDTSINYYEQNKRAIDNLKKDFNKDIIIDNNDNIILSKDFLKKEIYHSLNIEGYDINHIDIDNFFENKLLNKEKYLIISSYYHTLILIFNDLIKNKKDILSLDVLKKINYYTFFDCFQNQNPKIELEQHDFRKNPVRMNGSDDYFPDYSKDEIIDMVEYVFQKARQIDNDFMKWIFLHFCIIPIQPFQDWNGRLSRFLMNITFFQNTYNWLSIHQHNYRLKYCSSWKYIPQENMQAIKDIFNQFINFIYLNMKS